MGRKGRMERWKGLRYGQDGKAEDGKDEDAVMNPFDGFFFCRSE